MRETIKDILRLIPGYAGYESRESRRDADKTLRTNLATEYRRERQSITRLAQNAADGAGLEHLDRIENISQTLDRFIARLETAPRGYASWFDESQIDEADLDMIYEFDAKLTDNIPLLREQIDHAHNALNSGGDVVEALNALYDFVDGLNAQFDARQAFLTRGKQAT